ncbi:hypothetical protein B0A55_08130 [Friedmanniomyces simplex]|uniref:Uncharacterized protein n=1 Tax=Friedmanniomyces simplex TaxID=329884 RepID=A0A4U0X8Y7_9PEZI|nr:hypothetical protein B0A55_08130 [Friedmanniomyces simplex]
MAPTPPLLAALYARLERSDTTHSDIAGLHESSLGLDKRSTDSNPQAHIHSRGASPLDAHRDLTARDVASTYVPGSGAKPPTAFNNNFFLVLFAIIGVAMVIAALWFFFWAKNGGFHYQEGDWDDYKSTVLRRKGPDGKTLSNATKSTKLGYGASTIAGTQHYRWQKQAAKSVVSRDEKGRKGIRAKRGWAKTHSILYSDDYMTESFPEQTESDMTELRTEPDTSHGHSKRYRDRDVQQYKKEKSARVGGLNRMADGSHFGTTIAGSETMSEASSQPMLPKERNHEREKERAERKARDEAARMERRWKKEAEEAAALIARENAASRPPPPPVHTTPKKSAAPSSKPLAQKQRQASRSASPKKRDFSYQTGAPSEVLSTAYTGYTGESGTTGTSGTRTASYYDEYRPRASENPRYSSEQGVRASAGAGRSRQSSPKKGAGRKAREGGYRRGADSDLD